jgi:hypothetical protein
VSLSSLGSFRSVRRECGAIEFDEVADPINLNVCPLNRRFRKRLSALTAPKSRMLTTTWTGANPFPERSDSPIFVDPFDARI